MSKTPLKDFTDAAKLDIFNILTADNPHVFEFRRAQDIAAAMLPFINAQGHPGEHREVEALIRMAESKAPTLHDVLLGRAFDGDALLEQKYAQMLSEHTQLRHAALNIAEANETIARDRAEVISKQAEVKAAHRALSIERERLQLQADTEGKKVNLPTLPKLTKPRPVDEDEGEEVDLNDVKPKPGRWGVSQGDGDDPSGD
jgi:hypothetical protein